MTTTTTPRLKGSFASFDPLSIPLEGTRVVEASAGTGKTYSITLLYLRGLLELKLDPRSILVVTFTRAATAELRQRIREGVLAARDLLLGTTSNSKAAAPRKVDPTFSSLLAPYVGQRAEDALRRLAQALDSLDRASIFTIDGFCQRVLSQHAFEAGLPFEAELVTDSDAVVDTLAGDLWIARYATAPESELVGSAFQGPTDVGALLKQGVAHPDLPVLPTPVSDAQLAASEQRFARACAGFLAAREQSGPDQAILAAVKIVRSSVKSVKALDTLAAIARGERAPSGRSPDKWEYVSAIASAPLAKPSRELPALPVFAAVDELLEAASAVHACRLAQTSHAFLAAGRTRYRERTVERGKLTFSAIKTTLRDLLADATRGPAMVRSLGDTYAMALVDECQDTDSAQFEIFGRIFTEQRLPLLFIGDPKQAIYGFRGADVHAYLGAREAASERYTMDSNFRSRPELIDTLNRLYAAARAPFGAVEIRYRAVQAGKNPQELAEISDPGAPGAVQVLYVGPDDSMIRSVGADIVRTLRAASYRTPGGEARPLRPMHIAVLCRSNPQVDEMCRALRLLGVPAVASSNRSVLDTEEAEHLLRLLRATLDPSDARAVRAALLTPLFGYTPRALAALAGDDLAWDRIIEELLALRDRFQAHGLGHAFARFCRERRIEARLLRRPDGFRVVTNLSHLIELCMLAASERRLGPEGVLSWLERARGGQVDDGSATDERSLRLEHSGDAVQVLTVHKSKGLEFDLTYVVGLGQKPKAPVSPALVHHEVLGRVLVTDLEASPDLAARARAEQAEESARLVYVALTRAKLGLRVVFEAQSNGAEGSTTGLVSSALGSVLAGPDVPPPAKQKRPEQHLDGDALYTFLEARYAALSQTQGVSLALRRIDPARGAPYAALAGERPLHGPAACLRAFTSATRTSSFSGLVAGAEHARPADRDGTEAREGEVEADLDDPLADVPAGRGLGVLVHEILENLDFAADRTQIEAAVAHTTRSYPAFAEHGAALSDTVQRVLTTPLLEGGPRLADVPRKRTFRELEFHLSVNRPEGLVPAALGALFAAHQVPIGAPDYAARVAALPFASLRGYLHGFVDLIVEHERKFYVVDYKSNRLGRPAAYARTALVQPITASHYALQYALYTLALHRLLQQRLAHYDYEQHMGGALYLFLRGMHPKSGPASGIFAERLPFAFVDALDALFAGWTP